MRLGHQSEPGVALPVEGTTTCFACESESGSESTGGHAGFHGGHVTVIVAVAAGGGHHVTVTVRADRTCSLGVSGNASK